MIHAGAAVRWMRHNALKPRICILRHSASVPVESEFAEREWQAWAGPDRNDFPRNIPVPSILTLTMHRVIVAGLPGRTGVQR